MAGYKFTEPTDVKLIILYIIKNYNMPLDNGQVTDIFMSHAFVDYFTMQEYLEEMIESGLVDIYVEEGIRKYILTGRGQDAITYFIDKIPLTVRERILLSIRQYQKQLKNKLEIVADYNAINELEYIIDCSVSENGNQLFKISLNAASQQMASAACKKFKKDPQKVYAEILRVLLG